MNINAPPFLPSVYEALAAEQAQMGEIRGQC